MTWKRTDDQDLIEWPPYFIRRYPKRGRYVLGKHVYRKYLDGGSYDECLGGFDTSDAAKQAAGELMRQEAGDGSDS